MKITTDNPASFKYDQILTIACEDSTAVTQAAILISKNDTYGPWVTITWANGDQWGYRLPSLLSLVSLIGEGSVGRFANAVKREATSADKL